MGAKVIGDFIATSYTDALLISFRYFLEFLKEKIFNPFSLSKIEGPITRYLIYLMIRRRGASLLLQLVIMHKEWLVLVRN